MTERMMANFLELSCKIGNNFDFVQGAGGNTSIKSDGAMFIKSSGTWLANSLSEKIFLWVSLEKVRRNLKAGLDACSQDVFIENTNLRPSIELSLHALMPHKVVLHVHALDLIAFAVRSDGQDVLSERLTSFCWSWIPYARPGADLSEAVNNTLQTKNVDILVLGNHGLVVGGSNCDEAEERLNAILKLCRQDVRKVSNMHAAQLMDIARRLRMRLPNHETIHSLACDEHCLKRCLEGVLYPDQAVFLGPNFPVVRNGEAPEEVIEVYRTMTTKSPDYLLFEGLGVLVASHAKPAVDEMLRCHAEVLLRIAPDVNLRTLSGYEVAQLLNWDAEKYRQSID